MTTTPVEPTANGPTPLEQQQLHVGGSASPTFWHRVRFDLVARRARQAEARTVVDIGAGSGWLGLHLAGSGIAYRFTESSPVLADALVGRFGAPAVLADDDDIGDDALVVLLDVIEHIEDDASFLRQLAGRMQPGAGLVVTVPALPRLFSSWDTDLGHFRRYGRRSARRVVEHAGFAVHESSYVFPELLPIAMLRRFRPAGTDEAEFPDLPDVVDRIGAAISTLTARLRRLWPAGTSVVVVATRLGPRP